MSAPVTTESLLAQVNQPLPFSDEAEKGLLSCLLQEPDRIAETRMRVAPEAFYHSVNRTIYEALLAMDQSPDVAVDVVSLTIWLADRNELDSVGGAAAVSEFYTFVPIPAHYPHFTKVVMAKHHVRSGIGALVRGLRTLNEHGRENPDEPVTSLLSSVEQEVFMVLSAAQSSGGQGAVIGSVEMTNQWLDEMHKIEQNRGRVRGIATGWVDVDRAFGGLNPDGSGDLFVIAGYPGNGKTAAAVTLIEQIAVEQHVPTLVFPLEMGRMGVCHRFYLGRARVPITLSRNGHMSKDYIGPIGRASDDVMREHLFWDGSNNIDIDTLCARAKVHVRKHGVRAVVIDHFKHIAPSTKEGRKDRLQGQIEVMEKLHAMRHEMGVLIILLVQMNKDGRDTSSNMLPNLGHLRGASEIGEMATHVAFLHRPCLAKPFRTLGRGAAETARRQREWAEKTRHYRQMFPDLWSPEVYPKGWSKPEPVEDEEGEEAFVAEPWHWKDYEEHTLMNIAKNRHGSTPDNICLRFELERQRFTNRTPKLYSNNEDYRQVEIIGF